MGLFGSLRKKMSARNIIDESGINIPGHIAIIPDGNGRWAKKRGLPRSAGHKAGSGRLKEIVKYCDSIGVKYLTVYAFSTENWSRPREEVDYLMGLLLQYLKNAEKELEGTGVRIRVIGYVDGLSREFRQEISRVEKMTRDNNGLTLVFALNYGGRDEIVRTVKQLAERAEKGEISLDRIDESLISKTLYTAEIPDPDLVIRTSGEMRSSNFLLWQSAYSEYWFTKVFWPDFTKEHLYRAILDYNDRNRRYGGV